jgi:hypothetical protein
MLFLDLDQGLGAILPAQTLALQFGDLLIPRI